MKHTYDGLTLLYDTRDAPAPPERVSADQTPALVVGLDPPHPGNSVEIHFRVDGGPFRTLATREGRTDYTRGIQYFTAMFPRNLIGERVEYCPVATCMGRQVPTYGAEHDKLSSFILEKQKHDSTTATQSRVGEVEPHFKPGVEFVAQVTVQLKKPVVIGKTPEGLRIDFYVESGTAKGKGFNATVAENTVDYMLIHPDGVGVINVHATLLTDDGAVITAAYRGLIELGPNGYERMARGDYPPSALIQLAPRLLTEHPKYAWINRTYLLGVGQVDLRKLIVQYDAYAVKTLTPGAAP